MTDKQGTVLHSDHPPPPLFKQLSVTLKDHLNMINNLHNMEVLSSKPSLPAIIVLGDKSAGSATVLGELIGIKLPSDLQFPLILKFKSDFAAGCGEIFIQVPGEDAPQKICRSELQSKIAEIGNLQSEVTIITNETFLGELVIVLLPEIQTDAAELKKIEERFTGYIHQYTRNEERMFLNVLSCSSHYKNSLSKKVAYGYDWHGDHTITVFTHVHECSDYVAAQLTSKMNESLFGYFFIENEEDKKSADGIRLLSKVDEHHIGLDAIAKNLVIGMLWVTFNPSSIICERIRTDLESSKIKLKHHEKVFESVEVAKPTFMLIVGTAALSLQRLFIHRLYWEYDDEQDMHAAAEIEWRFKRLRIDLEDLKVDVESQFLMFEQGLLYSKNRPKDGSLFHPELVEPNIIRWLSYASPTINRYANDFIKYIKVVIVRVLLDHASSDKQLHSTLKHIVGQSVNEVNERFMKKVKKIVKLEEHNLFACDDDFAYRLSNIKEHMLTPKDIDGKTLKIHWSEGNVSKIEIQVSHLQNLPWEEVEEAFLLRKRTMVYWQFLVRRLVDNLALNLNKLIREFIGAFVQKIDAELMKMIKDEVKLPELEPVLASNKSILKTGIEIVNEANQKIKKKLQANFKFLL